jgi:hypothetical protein
MVVPFVPTADSSLAALASIRLWQLAAIKLLKNF